MKITKIMVILTILTAVTPLSLANGATIRNGVGCSKSGATIKVTIKGVVKTYVCKVNPSVPGATKRTWTLKTCISYWSTAQGSQKSIDEQRALIQIMAEPDRSKYLAEIDKSQSDLNKVMDAIRVNHCKAGL